MNNKHNPGEKPRPIDVREDAAFQERDWRAQIIGQLAVAAFVVAGVGGVFGGGWLGAVTAADAQQQVEVDYARFARADSPYDLTFHVAPELARAELLEVWIDLSLLETLHVEAVTPEPESQTIRGDRAVFAIRVAEVAGDVPVVFRVKAREVGRRTGRVGVIGGPEVELWHFVYP